MVASLAVCPNMDLGGGSASFALPQLIRIKALFWWVRKVKA
jgi:hypothetical protein